MEELFVAILSMLLVAALIPLYLWKRRQDSQSPPHRDEPPQAPQREAVARATATRRMRRRPAASGAASTSSDPRATLEESADESDNEAAGGEYYEAKASKKKEIKRQEREARRQADEAARESRQAKQDRYSEMRRLKDEEREAQERMLEEEARAQKAKEEEAAALEFEKWKGEFSVDDEGTLEEVQDSTTDLLANFVEYIKKHKCVPLEDLAAEFKLRTQECINRITSLESRLSGVMDDRGKFIYISQEEMKAVADYIKRQGRVSISHLASKSNQFIDLEPKAQYSEDINIVEEITIQDIRICLYSLISVEV
ncbi:DDRGK domain-containing protein 1, partial [Mucuna pruriens]